MQRGTAREPNATDAGRSSHPLHGSGGAVLLQLELLALRQAAQQATRMARQLPAPMCCCSSCLQVGLFPSRQAAQHAIAPAMKQQRQWFDKLRAELAPPAGMGSKKGQGGGSGLLSSERLTHSNSDRCRPSVSGCTCHASPQYCPPGLPRGVGLPNAAAGTLHNAHRGPGRSPGPAHKPVCARESGCAHLKCTQIAACCELFKPLQLSHTGACGPLPAALQALATAVGTARGSEVLFSSPADFRFWALRCWTSSGPVTCPAALALAGPERQLPCWPWALNRALHCGMLPDPAESDRNVRSPAGS